MISSSAFFKKTFLDKDDEIETTGDVGISPWFRPQQAKIRSK